MRYSRTLIGLALIFGITLNADAQRCSTGASDMPANASPEQMAIANIDILFDGVPLTRDQRRKAIAIYADAFKALLRLDFRSPEYQSGFTAVLAKRNQDLWLLAPSDSARAKLEACFRQMKQPVPAKRERES